jgi:glycerol-3-phosphate dehydrogenase
LTCPSNTSVASLDVLDRAAAVSTLVSEPFDVLVIGGGITGAGVALDAATRGYSGALVERADYASGTSSRSSKLVHGGQRYLQNFDLGLVREALLERQINVALAPHLVKPLPLIVPAFDGARPDRLVGLGLNMYDVMAVDRISPLGRRRDRNRDGVDDWSPARHRVISGEEVAELLPALAGRSPSGGYLFYDCQTDDVRLVLTVLAEAERFGAVAVNGVEAVGLLEEGGRAVGARLRDGESGAELEVRAANVVNATGVWADRLRPEELHDEAEVPVIRPSRGTHIIVPGATLPLKAGAIAPAGGGRTIFVLPWLGQTLIGTTDNDYEGDIDHVRPADEDVAYLLEAVNAFFATGIVAEDIAGAYAGVRPLISTGDPKKSVDISRKAELYETSSGMVTITGGKLTTWRRMAKMTVDRLVERDGRDAPCRTGEIPLGMPVDAAELTRVEGVGEEAYEQLAGRYGFAAHDVLTTAAERGELAQPILPGMPDLLAEAAFSARREQARSVSDVLLRRTRLGLTAARRLCAPGEQAPERVARALGAELGWDDARCAAEAERFRADAGAEGLVVGSATAVGPAP